MQSALTNAMLVGSGGFLGALLRYGLSGFVQQRFGASGFPYGTLSVNLIGCLLIGALAGLADSRQPFSSELRAFVLIGLLGGFTTFSAFGYETFALARDGDHLRALGNVGGHLFFCLGAVWLGYAIASTR